MMVRLAGIFLFLHSVLSYAQHSIEYKKEEMVPFHWYPYLLCLIILGMLLVYLKKQLPQKRAENHCQILEKKIIHQKTKVYIIDYHGQKFLIADNHNALAIHQLNKRSEHDAR